MTSLQGLFNSVDYVYRGVWKEYGEACIEDLPLVSGGPWTVLGIIAIYLWFVKVKGPSMMKNRKPYDLKWIILAYNLFTLSIHIVLFPFALYAFNFTIGCWKCRKLNLIDPPNMHKEIWAMRLAYIYFFCKFLELCDTVFFILRKKTSHVSRFHVFHHSSTPIVCWLLSKFSPWYPVAWGATLNAFVHIIMYGYYTLALLEVKNLLWLKKLVTQVQITQFLLIIVHAVYFLQHKTCTWPKVFAIFQLLHGILFLYFFSSLYYRAYVKKRATEKKVH